MYVLNFTTLVLVVPQTNESNPDKVSVVIVGLINVNYNSFRA
jgi:hypothetical protein